MTQTDLVIVPSMEFGREGEWTPGRYPKLVHWLCRMYDGGATICSACIGGNLTAEAAQRAIADNFAVAAPVEEMVRWSGLAPRTFKRRFKLATNQTPIAYVQGIRVERAKRLLETSDEPIEEVSWAVGYEDPASFRRLFKRLAGLSPGATGSALRFPSCPRPRDVHAGGEALTLATSERRGAPSRPGRARARAPRRARR